MTSALAAVHDYNGELPSEGKHFTLRPYDKFRARIPTSLMPLCATIAWPSTPDGHPPMLSAAVERLPQITRCVEDLAHLDGWPRERIARALRLPVEQVDEHLATARDARAALSASREEDASPAAAQARVAAIIELACAGVRPSRIAVELGLPSPLVHVSIRRARERGEHIPRAVAQKPWDHPDIPGMLIAGMTDAQIAGHLGVEKILVERAVCRLRRRGGKFPARPGGRGPQKRSA